MSSSASHSTTNTMSTELKTKKTAAKKVDIAAPAVTVAAPAEKKVRRAPAAKTEVIVPVVETAAPATTAAAAAVVATPPSFAAVADRLKEIQIRVTAELKDVVREALAAAKTAARDIKDARKKRRVKKDPADMTPEEKTAWEARRANNAFLKPRPLSAELCSFMGVPAASQRSQTDVTKHVSQYVKSHGCFDPANKRRIIPDGALSKLLKVTDKDVVTYLNLQSFLKAHFIKV